MKLIDADALIEFIDPEHLRHPGELALDKACEEWEGRGRNETI